MTKTGIHKQKYRNEQKKQQVKNENHMKSESLWEYNKICAKEGRKWKNTEKKEQNEQE